MQVCKNHGSFKDVLESIFKGLLNGVFLGIPGIFSKNYGGVVVNYLLN